MDFRKKIGIFLLAGAMVLAGFLLFSPSDTSKLTDNQGGSTNVKAEPFQLEKDNEKIGQNLEFLAFNPEESLTDRITADISQRVLDLNQNNDLSAGNLTVPNEELFSQELIDKYKNDFLANLQEITIDDLRPIQDNLPYSSIDYLKGVFQIIRDNKITDDLVIEAIAGFAETENEDFLTNPINSLDKAILELKQLPIPTSWLALHRELINLNLTKKEILSSFHSSPQDPIKALIAADLLSEIDAKAAIWSNYAAQKLQQDGVVFEFN